MQILRQTQKKMAERKSDSSEKDVKSRNILERAKEEFEALFHSHKLPRHTKETHGTSDDIDKNTPIDEVKGPNVFERVKEEVEALVEAIHPKKESKDHGTSPKEESEAVFHSHKLPHHTKETHGTSDDIDKNTPIDEVKGPNVFERVKEEVEALFHSHKLPRHTKETHGTSDDIDKNTPIDEVKGPNVFERVKEEVEAIVESIHPKKESKDHGTSPK